MTRSARWCGAATAVALVLATVTGCSATAPSTPPAPAAAPPSASPAEQWSGRFCAAVDALEHQKVASAEVTDRILHPPAQFPGAGALAATLVPVGAKAVLQAAADDLDRTQQGLGAGTPAVDDWIARYATAARGVLPQLDAISESVTSQVPYASHGTALVDLARQSDALIQSVHPPVDLVTLRSQNPQLDASLAATPSCADDGSGAPVDGVVPDRPLPPATDGAAVDACADGACQILVTRQAAFTMGTRRVVVSVYDGETLVAALQGTGDSSATGAAGLSTDQPPTDLMSPDSPPQLSARLVGSTRDRAVVELTQR